MPQQVRARTASPRSRTAKTRSRDVPADVAYALKWLERRGTKKNRDGMARYGIVAKKAFGVSMGTMQAVVADAVRSGNR